MSKNFELRSISLWLIKAGLFIVPFIPLYISRVLFFPYITGKAFAFRIIVEIVFALWVWLAVFYKEYRPTKSYLFYALSAFIVIVALATLFGINIEKSFWSNYERMEGLVTYLHLFAYFLVLGSVFGKKDWNIFSHLFLAAGLLENAYGTLQHLGILESPQGGAARSDGTIGNPTYLAAYLLFILFFCLLLWFNAKSRPLKYFYGISAAWTAIVIYFTATRGVTLALLGGAALFAVLYLFLKPSGGNEKSGLSKKAILIALGLLVAIPAGIWLLRNTALVHDNPVLSRLTLLSLKERTITSRFTIWQMSWEAFKDRPILGWGPDNYAVVFSKYFKTELWRQEPWFDRSHDIIFDWLINAGLLGLLAYLSIFAAAFYLIWDSFKKKYLDFVPALLVFVLLAAYFFQNLFVFDQIATYISFFSVLAYLQSINAGPVAEVAPVKNKKEKFGLPAFGASLFAAAALVYAVNFPPLLANLNLLEALKVQGQDIEGAFNLYKQALAYNTFGNAEIREQFVRFAISAGGQPQASPVFRDTVLRTAITEAQKGVEFSPDDPRPYLFLGELYSSIGLFDQALQVFQKVISLSPNKQQIYFSVADVYIRKSDYKNAALVLETSFNLDREYVQAGLNLATVYILSGRQNDADKILLELFGRTDPPQQMLAQVYSRVKNYGRLIGIWKSLAKSDPSNLEYQKNLAGAYLANNQKVEAIQVLQDAILQFPDFKAEGENYLRQIK